MPETAPGVALLLVALLAWIAGGAAGAAPASQPGAEVGKPRLLVTTDIGGDPDDQQAMVRLMTYACDFEIEGLIASASGTPGELKRAVVQPQLIREIVDAYGQVRPNLLRHRPDYPEAALLRERIKPGNPQRGRGAIGEGHDTEGSRWIVQVVDRPDPRPVNLSIWGGQTDLAQALWRVRHDRGAARLQTFLARLRVHDIADQDGLQPWLLENFPGLCYVLSQAAPGADKRTGVFRGMYLGGDEALTSRAWIDTHVRAGHGPLGALYPPKTWTAPNPHSALKEGDTPSWFHFLDHGLSDPAHPDWGGWGGRFRPEHAGWWRDAQDTLGDTTDGRATVWRWRPAFQAAFQARMDWCVKPFAEANHPPRVVLNGDATRRILHLSARPGAAITLSAAGSSDPDGQDLRCRWWVYREAGTYGGPVSLRAADTIEATVAIPADAAGKTLHVVLEAIDTGSPALTSYRRAVLELR